jgi:putative ABC transport system substrate-binding protein
MELLSELVPKTATFGLFVTTNSTFSDSEVRDTQSAARAMGRDLRVFSVNTERDIDVAFADLAALPNPALIVSVDPFFDSHPDQLIELAARHAVPTVYYLRDFTQAGGLVSYGASITDTYRQAGIYAGRILKGAKPSELPIQLPTRFELVINLKTAKMLDLAVPPTLLARADAVIE